MDDVRPGENPLRSPDGTSWTPPTDSAALVPAGVAWDAVKVPAAVGRDVLSRLGDRGGAVIEDRYMSGCVMFWLVAPGAANHWPHRQIEVYGPATSLIVPPTHKTEGPGLRWLVPLTTTRYLTDAALLYDALSGAVDTPRGPRGADNNDR